MAQGYLLSEADVAALRRIYQAVGAGKLRHAPPSEDEPSSAVYIAKAPAGGIPALSAGTGPAGLDVPGSARCAVYRIVQLRTDPGTAGTLEPEDVDVLDVNPEHTEVVYNLSAAAVPEGTLVQLHKDRWGHWLVVLGGSGSDCPCAYSRGATLKVVTTVCTR